MAAQHKFAPPYLGAAYYPEVWDEKEIDRDIQRMKDLGVNVVRIAEFAWVFMEPEEGKYDFRWLHNVVQKLTNAGIAIVMCTPTATPPVWLTKKYPETLRVMPTGQSYSHGGRRHYCPNSPVYREFSRKITEKLAEGFSNYPSIVAWQLDNEFGGGSDFGNCYCKQCEKSFHEFLEKIYLSIDNLNQSWGTGIWSQKYSRFEEIPLPKPNSAWHHPSLIFYYQYFMSKSYSDYAREQIRIIRKYTDVPITTNGMPPFAHRIDYEDLFSELDFASNDLYYPIEEIWKACPELDWMRAFKKKPYWIMETSSTWSPGSVFVHQAGAMRAKCWLFYALGGEAVLFWLWRAQWSGQEMEHGSLTYSNGEPTLSEKEFRQVSKEINKVKEFLNETRPENSEVAIHFSYPSLWTPNGGSASLTGFEFNYLSFWQEFYRIFLESNIARDVIFPHSDVSQYKVVFSPYMVIIPQETIKKMEEFVLNGGIWIIGPMSGFRNEHCTAFKEGAYGPLEKIVGASVRHRFPAEKEGGKINWPGYRNVKCYSWCDAFQVEKNTKIIATYADGPANGMASVIERSIGKGKIIVLGTCLAREHLSRWLVKEIRKSVRFNNSFKSERGTIIVKRVGDNNKLEGIIAVDIVGKGDRLIFEKGGIDLLSDKKVEKEFTLPPYGVAVIKFEP